jgi:hypothetical protein
MRKIACAITCSLLVSGCAPSLQYRLGQGFYSEGHAKTQVQAAANAGNVTNLGRFSTDVFGCGNYSQDIVDRNLIVPAIRRELQARNGNAADNVVANEPWTNFLLGLLILPTLAGCSGWTVSGEALRVEAVPQPPQGQ